MKDYFKIHVEDMKNRIQIWKENPSDDVYTFCELKINPQQIPVINKNFFGFETDKEVHEYLKGKIDKSVCCSQGAMNTREDHGDLQYIFDLGLQALKQGLSLDNKVLQNNCDGQYYKHNEI